MFDNTSESESSNVRNSGVRIVPSFDTTSIKTYLWRNWISNPNIKPCYVLINQSDCFYIRSLTTYINTSRRYINIYLLTYQFDQSDFLNKLCCIWYIFKQLTWYINHIANWTTVYNVYIFYWIYYYGNISIQLPYI